MLRSFCLPAVLWAMIATIASSLFAQTPAPAAPPLVSPVAFFKHADFGKLELSPSGMYIGGLLPVNGRLHVAVLDVASTKLKVVGGVEDHDVTSFSWVNDNRLVFSVSDLQVGLGEQRGGGLFVVDRDGTEVRELAPTVKKRMNQGQMVPRYTALFATLRDGSDDILVVANDSNVLYPDIYRMNTKTGRRTLKTLDKPGDVVRWVVDRKGSVRAAVAVEKGTVSRMFWRPADDAKWVEMGAYQMRDARITPVAFDGDGSLIVASNVGRDTFALYRYDTEKKALGELLVAHPHIDLDGGVQFDRGKNKIVGVAYDAERPGTAWFDEDWARLQNTVDRALPERMNVLARGDAPRVLVFSYSDTDPGAYYIFDPDKRRMEFLASVRKDIKPDAMPKRQPIRYAARDGLEIPAYLTLPPGKAPTGLPLVLYVHGGPWVRGGHWAWRDEPAFLAMQGYAVLEPEFRASTGWGGKLFMAGWKQWGQAMQDDLNDGMDWLAKAGTIDPKRACIMGASYGGYAVMMGLARDPERWRCGINYAGVTDINMMFDVTWSDMSNSDFLRYSAKEMIGDPVKDAAMFKAYSPLENAAKIKAPVLMAYGGEDVRVPRVHGERMRDALLKQGTPVEWVVYEEEAHGFLLESNRYDFYSRVAKFLDANLRP